MKRIKKTAEQQWREDVESFLSDTNYCHLNGCERICHTDNEVCEEFYGFRDDNDGSRVYFLHTHGICSKYTIVDYPWYLLLDNFKKLPIDGTWYDKGKVLDFLLCYYQDGLNGGFRDLCPISVGYMVYYGILDGDARLSKKVYEDIYEDVEELPEPPKEVVLDDITQLAIEWNIDAKDVEPRLYNDAKSIMEDARRKLKGVDVSHIEDALKDAFDDYNLDDEDSNGKIYNVWTGPYCFEVVAYTSGKMYIEPISFNGVNDIIELECDGMYVEEEKKEQKFPIISGASVYSGMITHIREELIGLIKDYVSNVGGGDKSVCGIEKLTKFVYGLGTRDYDDFYIRQADLKLYVQESDGTIVTPDGIDLSLIDTDGLLAIWSILSKNC